MTFFSCIRNSSGLVIVAAAIALAQTGSTGPGRQHPNYPVVITCSILPEASAPALMLYDPNTQTCDTIVLGNGLQLSSIGDVYTLSVVGAGPLVP